MTALTDLAKGKLQDPVLMDWALDRYREAQKRAPSHCEAMEQAWFDELTLRRWLERDDAENLTRLFVTLPAARFEQQAPAIAQRWPRWSGSMATRSAEVIARYQPALATRCFADRAASYPLDAEALLGAIRALPWLPEDLRSPLLARLAKAVLAESRDLPYRSYELHEFLRVSLRIDGEVALDVLRAELAGPVRERDLPGLLWAVAAGFFGHGAHLRLASDIRSATTRQSFQSLAAFFREDAPLDQLDQFSRGPADSQALLDLAETHLDPGIVHVLAVLAEMTRSGKIAGSRDLVADCLIGAVAAGCARDHVEAAGLDLDESIRLLAADIEVNPHFEVLLGRLGELDPNQVDPVLVETLATGGSTYGGVRVAQAMGRLARESFLAPLTAAMDEQAGDLLREAAAEALAFIGEPARDHLIRQWDDLDDSQRIFGLSVIEAVGGEPTAAFAVSQYPELFPRDPESWCRLARSAPDRRLLDLLEAHLPRRQLLFDESFYQIARLLDVAHPELEAIGEQVRQRRAKLQARRAAMARGEWFEETLTLELKCPVCGDANRYDVRRVAVDPSSPGNATLLAHELPCASCGQWVDFELTSGAHMALTAELVALAASSDAGLAGRSKVLVRAEAPLNGRSYPVAEVISRCKAAVAEDPTRVADWLRLGFCYHRILSRPRYAMRFAEKALALMPEAVESSFQMAQALSLRGDSEGAFRVLDDALAHKDCWRLYLLDVATPAQFSVQFAHFYNGLLHQLQKADRPRLHTAFFGGSRKPGRNDPCPCGSGKKYKHCCQVPR